MRKAGLRWLLPFLSAALCCVPIVVRAQIADSTIVAPAPKTASERARLLLGNSTRDAATLRIGAPTSDEIERVKRRNADAYLKRAQIGIGIDTAAIPESRGEALQWHPVASGGVAAQWHVTAPDAAALRVALEGARVPAGAQLRFAGDGDPGTVYGPYDWSEISTGAPYWSPVLEGSGALVEVFVPGATGLSGASLSVSAVSYFFVSPREPRAESVAKSGSGSCEVDLICRSAGDPSLGSAGRSVARMTFVEGGSSYLCTGSLLATSGGGTTPYFYTANHCIGTQAAASTLTTHWFYETTGCGNEQLSPNYVQVPGGAALLYASQPTDVSFLRLNAPAPAGAVLIGWDASPVANGTALTAIHHPEGDYKKVSLGAAAGFATVSGFSGSFLAVRWNSVATGITEEGSSGSGIFSRATDGAYRFRGGLLGGPSSCSAPASQLVDYYSRLDQAWPNLSNYLDVSGGPPGGGGGCSYTLTPANASAPASGTTGSFSVTANGSCSWTATSNASWISTSSAGAGNGTVRYSIAPNTSSGSRTGAIVVGGAAFTVTQAGQGSAPGPANNSLTNGDFEAGRTAWTEVASSGFPIIRANSAEAHAGSWYAWLGGVANSADTLSQEFTLPASSPRLQFWYRITSSDTRPGIHSGFAANLVNLSNGQAMTLASFSNQSVNNGWALSPPYDLSAYAGQRVRLEFRSASDDGGVSNFYLDDIAVYSDTSVAGPNYTSLWWNPAESGWGINITHQGDVLFATLFAYAAFGTPFWAVMPAGIRVHDATAKDSFAGPLYVTHGNPYFSPFIPANVSQVGNMQISFTGENSATLSYDMPCGFVASERVGGTPMPCHVQKQLTRQVFGARAAVCRGTTGSRTSATNYQDLWWNPSESGWGLNITHQGDTMFATLFVYDGSLYQESSGLGNPHWYVMTSGKRQADGSYSGDLYSTTGTAFWADFTPIGPSNVKRVGSMTLRFSDGENGKVDYIIDGAEVMKSITRQIFSSPVPSCVS